jgi:COP9 signalosome complex subunit 6
VIGWYAVGEEPTLDDVFVQQQVGLCLYLLFHPSSTPDQDLPVTIYESALAEGSNDDESAGKFVELEYGIETGEAERIAGDGVSRGDTGGGDEDSGA